ncbi:MULTISPECIES: hypothetical protein [unclassified Streptomyces]|uniref:hypothetical protein n=1 Tax=unclassified Streptomyces TaxID=2593676 RepID=UPI000DAB4C21|nr:MULTISPECIES: hypothetical protein [unclassified Streptomyces]PZT72272.1 hypothetical protein DNK55_27310 [Streptomyces sp. AC1-42T]PZT81405.1 hypothetical protein DNK56_04255 [Streptomyces sp. AC1-42W]
MTHENPPTDLLDFPGGAALARAGRTEPPAPEAAARARSLVLAAIAADAAAPAPAPARRFARRRVFALAAAVAAVATGAAVLPVVGFGDDGPAATASASEVFTTMADHTTTGAGAGTRYWKTEVRSWAEGRKARTDTRYLSRDGVVVKTQDGRTLTKENPGGTSWPVGKGTVDWDGLGTLPTDPDALRGTLSAGARGADAAAEQTVRQAGRLLTDAPVSPEVRAALFRVLAQTPGATVTEGVKDAVGRSGTRISWKWAARPTESNKREWGWSPTTYKNDKGGWKIEATAALRENWIVSPTDGRLLEVGHDPDDRPGHVVQRETYLNAGPAKTTH